MFYITPYNDGKKLRLVTGELPKTHILAANHYELEILRILALWDIDNPKVRFMIDETLKRLNTTCFAHWCPAGECVGAAVTVLRFISVLPEERRKDEWINQILPHLFEKNVSLPVFYMYSALPDIANALCLEFIADKKDWLIGMLTKGHLTGPAVQDTYCDIRKYVLRNALAMLPEYAHLKNRKIYISPKDSRCYFDVDTIRETVQIAL
jgi:hypothetical protein